MTSRNSVIRIIDSFNNIGPLKTPSLTSRFFEKTPPLTSLRDVFERLLRVISGMLMFLAEF